VAWPGAGFARHSGLFLVVAAGQDHRLIARCAGKVLKGQDFTGCGKTQFGQVL
jgi:hypothetical protein